MSCVVQAIQEVSSFSFGECEMLVYYWSVTYYYFLLCDVAN